MLNPVRSPRRRSFGPRGRGRSFGSRHADLTEFLARTNGLSAPLAPSPPENVEALPGTAPPSVPPHRPRLRPRLARPRLPIATESPDGVTHRSPSRPHWQGLDGLRGIAVIAVVIYHFSLSTLRGGFLGVDVFFVISGYLITRLLTQERLGRGGIDIRKFYVRRARRLLPALAVVLAAVSTAALVWRDQLATLRPAVLSTAVFGANWWLAFDHQSYFQSVGRPSMLQHLWSLGVEEQFYLFWPLLIVGILALARRFFGSRDWSPARNLRALGLVAVCLSLLSTGLTWLLADLGNVPYGSDGSVLYYGTDTHCMGLLLGAALGAWTVARHWDQEHARTSAQPAGDPGGNAPVVDGGSRRRVWGARLLGAAGVGAFLLLLATLRHESEYSLSLYRGGFLVLAVIVCVVIAAATRSGSRLGAFLDNRVLRWVGLRSYSIYLWHWPVAVVSRPGIDTTMPIWLDQTIRIAITLMLSDITYRFVETPARRLGIKTALAAFAERVRSVRWSPRPWASGLGAGSLAAVALVGVSVLVAGPSAPPPAAALGANPGGRNLVLPTHHRTPPSGAKKAGTSGKGTTGGSSPTPPSSTPAWRHLPAVSGYGDSVLLVANAKNGQRYNLASIDAIKGTKNGPNLADIRADARAGKLAPLVVIHLGNNGVIDPADLQRTLAMLTDVPLVLILNDHLDPYVDTWQSPNNSAINRIAAQFSNVHVINWNGLAGEHPGWLYPDDIHLRPAGASAYANILAAAARRYGPH